MRYYIEKLGQHAWALIDKDIEADLENYPKDERVWSPHIEFVARSIEHLIRVTALLRADYSEHDGDPRVEELDKILDVVRVKDE